VWLVSPEYRGPVLIRGRQLDGSHELRFGSSGTPTLPAELRIGSEAGLRPDGPAAGWRDWPDYTIVPAPGCYAYQVDGLGFTQIIAFEITR
jgi:hypothetical protein